MKKIKAISMIVLTVFSTFAVFTPKLEALDEQLTTNFLPDYDPSWSPDGTKIAYVGHATSWYRHIWVMNNDGTGKTQLTSGDVVDASPSYSPDGTKIAFQRWGFRGDRFDIMMMNADGTGVTRKTFNGLPGKIEGTYEQPMWSEDGTKLIFHYGEGTTGSPKAAWWICVMPVTGTDVDIELRGRGGQPMFCKDDTKILFHTDPTEGPLRIALMNADGTGREYLTDGPNDQLPHMSLITHRILFYRNRDLYVIDVDPCCYLSRITTDETNGYGVWSPDENYIAYNSEKSGNDDIWKMEAPSAPSEGLAPSHAYGLSHPPAGGYDGNLVLHRIDVDPYTAEDQQMVTVEPGESISIAYEMQIWSGGGPSIIRQAIFVYSWTPTWNPPSSGQYFVVNNGGTDYYPGITITDSEKPFSLTAPSEDGEYNIWLCGDAQYNVPNALNNIGDPTLPPGPYSAHAKIIVGKRNLIKNPGFEEQLDYWSVSEGTATFVTDTNNPRSGVYCAEGVELNEGSLGRLYQDVTDLVSSGGQYKISGWIKTQNVIGWVVIALDYVASSGWTPADGYVKEIGYVTGTEDWAYHESDVFTLPPMPSDAIATWFLFDFNAGKGTAWWDDLSLIEVTPPPVEEITFFPPYEAGLCSDFSWHEGTAYAWSSCMTHNDDGIGDIEMHSYSLPSFGKALSWSEFILGNTWTSERTGLTRIIAYFTLDGFMRAITWGFPSTEPPYLPPGHAFAEARLNASVSIIDRTIGQEIGRKDRVIFEKTVDWIDFLPLPWPMGKTEKYNNNAYTIDQITTLEQGHVYTWQFSMKMESKVVTVGLIPATSEGEITATLLQVKIKPLGPWTPPPEEPPATEDMMYIGVSCPVSLLVTDPDGRRIGFDPVSQQEVNEIPDAWYSGVEPEAQLISISESILGDYNVEVYGTGNGNYTLFVLASMDGILMNTFGFGETIEGAVYVYTASITDEAMTTSPDPTAELEHLTEFIDDIPDDCFDQTTRRADHFKKALLTKIDEVILKVEAGNYTDAVNKLSYDIRAKMDGDSTPVDWIVDREKQHSLCTIIEHIISSIEVLQQA